MIPRPFVNAVGRRLEPNTWHKVGRCEIIIASPWRVRLVGGSEIVKVPRSLPAAHDALEHALYTGREPTAYLHYAFGHVAVEAVK